MDEASIERELQASGKTAPRLSPADIDAAIMSEHYFTGIAGATAEDAESRWNPHWEVPRSHEALSCLTICVLVLRNGFTVTGESACASPDNFDAEIGRKIAREKAREKIWPLEGYLLRNRLANEVSAA